MQDLENILNQISQTEEEENRKETSNKRESDPRLLDFKKNNTYKVRLIPNIKNPKKTFETYKTVGFTSRLNNKFIFGGRSPSDGGVDLKEDLFNKAQWELYEKSKSQKDEDGMKESYKLIPRRNQLVNAYLIDVEGDDAEAKEKIGKVVVIRYGAQIRKKKDGKDGEFEPVSDLYRIIYHALYGDRKAKIGTNAIDVANGCTFVINVTEKAGYNDYGNSYFDFAESLNLPKDKIDEIYSSIHDLSEFVPSVLSKEEITKILNEHWYCISASPEDEMDESDESDVSNDSDDQLEGLASEDSSKKDNFTDELLSGL